MLFGQYIVIIFGIVAGVVAIDVVVTLLLLHFAIYSLRARLSTICVLIKRNAHCSLDSYLNHSNEAIGFYVLFREMPTNTLENYRIENFGNNAIGAGIKRNDDDDDDYDNGNRHIAIGGIWCAFSPKSNYFRMKINKCIKCNVSCEMRLLNACRCYASDTKR